MTRKEAINYLRSSGMSEGQIDDVTDALEYEAVLDKIRAEIVQMPTISFNANDIYKADVLAIIDKYKVGSEDKSCDNCKWNKTDKCQPSTCAMIGCDGHGLWEMIESEDKE